MIRVLVLFLTKWLQHKGGLLHLKRLSFCHSCTRTLFTNCVKRPKGRVYPKLTPGWWEPWWPTSMVARPPMGSFITWYITWHTHSKGEFHGSESSHPTRAKWSHQWFKHSEQQWGLPNCGSGDISHNLQTHISKDCPIHTLQELATKVEIYPKIKKSKMHFLHFQKFQTWSIYKHYQSSHNDFAKLPLKEIHNPSKKISNFSQPISLIKSIFSPFEPSSEIIMHCMECTQVKCTHPSNTPTGTLQLSCNKTKETHLLSCTQTMFSFYDTSK